MNYLVYIFIFVFGSIIGSFLNVVIDRINTGRGLGGRSHCDVTGKKLKWYELVPIISYLVQGGKSRYSKSPISIQYPLVEFGTGALFVLIFVKLLPISFAYPESFVFYLFFYFLISSILVAIFAYDIKHKIIPNYFVWQFNILALLSIFLTKASSLQFVIPSLGSLLAGPLVALPIFFIWLISRGRWIGFGDVKYCLGMGWLLGVSGGFSALLLSFWIGAVFGILIILKGGLKNHQIPFAPFLVLGTLISFLYNIDMGDISSLFIF